MASDRRRFFFSSDSRASEDATWQVSQHFEHADSAFLCIQHCNIFVFFDCSSRFLWNLWHNGNEMHRKTKIWSRKGGFNWTKTMETHIPGVRPEWRRQRRAPGLHLEELPTGELPIRTLWEGFSFLKALSVKSQCMRMARLCTVLLLVLQPTSWQRCATRLLDVFNWEAKRFMEGCRSGTSCRRNKRRMEIKVVRPWEHLFMLVYFEAAYSTSTGQLTPRTCQLRRFCVSPSLCTSCLLGCRTRTRPEGWVDSAWERHSISGLFNPGSKASFEVMTWGREARRSSLKWWPEAAKPEGHLLFKRVTRTGRRPQRGEGMCNQRVVWATCLVCWRDGRDG